MASSKRISGDILFSDLEKYIAERDGRFFQDETGGYSVIVGNRRILLNLRDNNVALDCLLLRAIGEPLGSPETKDAVKRLRVKASEVASKPNFHKFSAMSDDRQQLYIPVKGGKLLCISATVIEIVENGRNYDSIYVEHPTNSPFRYELTQDPAASFRIFRSLLVESQSCANKHLAWFTAMGEAIFPFVRGLCPARFITVHRSGSQQGKTTAAEHFMLFHGLGSVAVNPTEAGLANAGDTGFLAIDNIEQCDLKTSLISLLLLMATGGTRSRSDPSGNVRANSAWPVCVVTSIEGLFKTELQNRTIEVEYKKEMAATRGRLEIESQITKQRHAIFSDVIVPTLQLFLGLRRQIFTPIPPAMSNFQEHYIELCNLLRSFIAKEGINSLDQADEIIKGWDFAVTETFEERVDDLDAPIASYLNRIMILKVRHGRLTDPTDIQLEYNYDYEGVRGTLFITTTYELLKSLRDHDKKLPLPVNEQGFGRRLRSGNFKSFRVLDSTSGLNELKRRSTKRLIGLFLPMTT